MGIRRIQCRSCFDGVAFKVNFRFSKFEEVETLFDGFSSTSANVMLYKCVLERSAILDPKTPEFY